MIKPNILKSFILSMGIGAGAFGMSAREFQKEAEKVPNAPEPTKVIIDEEDGTQITPEGFEYDPTAEAARLEAEQAKLDQQRQAHHDSAKFYALLAAGLGATGLGASTLSGKSKKDQLLASIGRFTMGVATKKDLLNLLPYTVSAEDISGELKSDNGFPPLIQGAEGLSKMFRLMVKLPKQVSEYELPLIVASSGDDLRFGLQYPSVTISANAFPGILKRIPERHRDLIGTLLASEAEQGAKIAKGVLKASWQAVSTGQPPATKADWLNIIPHVKSIKKFDDQLILDIDPVALGIPQKKRGVAKPLTISLRGGLSRDGHKITFHGPNETSKHVVDRFDAFTIEDFAVEILRALPKGIPLEQKRLVIDLYTDDGLPEGKSYTEEYLTDVQKINNALAKLFTDLNEKSLYQALDPKNIESIKDYLDSIKGLSCKAMVASIYDNTVSYLRTNGVIKTEYSRTFDQTSFTDNFNDQAELEKQNELFDAFVSFKAESNEQNTVTFWNLLKAHIVHDGSTPLASPLDDQAYGDCIGQILEHENNFFEKLKPGEPELEKKLGLGLFKVTTKDTSNEDKRHNSQMANDLNHYLSMITKGRNDQTKITNIYTRIAEQLRLRGVIQSYIPFELTKNSSQLITFYSMFTDDALRTKVKNFWAGLIGHIIANSSKHIQVSVPKVTKVEKDGTNSELTRLENDLFANVSAELHLNNPERALSSVRLDDSNQSMIPYLKLVGIGANHEIKVAAIYQRVQECLMSKGVIRRVVPFDRNYQFKAGLIDSFAEFEKYPDETTSGTFWRKLTAYINSCP